ncbi:hypothetical protein [Tengunoibacter tsumagoiensis]|uniref:HAMP domain-containing protein n=1 Tax=Tengunoibacter tsumagoiensis TaxID=2014871 RepID=A0A402A6R0_9CHLR|nr:hypothetical protein [Tengunoibacter tsumagoiensis]GCE14705.1 hypothetical protein KTT_45640 [Tengunoibacter tsumagoiensis]
MNKSSLPDTPFPRPVIEPDALVESVHEAQRGFLPWWYNLTAMPEVSVQASFLKREEVRKSRLLSNVLFFYGLILLLAIPACLFVPNKIDVWIALGMFLSTVCALYLNRSGQVTVAGFIVIAVFEVALTIGIFTTLPLDEPTIQIYDLYIITELLAVSLLPARSIFLVAALNSGIVLISLVGQPHTMGLAADLHTQFLPIMIRPIILFIIVAGVAYVWVSSVSRAIARADRAEMVMKLEHALVEQKRDLEEGIEQILQTHVAIANGNLNARAPLTQDSSLWQIARALNTLLVRLQRAVVAEKELQRVEQAVTISVQSIQRAEQMQKVPELGFTQTAIDPLVAALQGKTIAQTPLHQAQPMFIPSSQGGVISYQSQSRGSSNV